MRTRDLVLGAVILLSGCSSGYFDQHPANVRPESEAVAVVIARHQPGGGTESGLVPSAPSARVAETVLPAATPLAPTRVASPVRSMPVAPAPPKPHTMSGTTAMATASVPSGEALHRAMVQAEPPFPTTRQPASPASALESQPSSEQAAPNPAFAPKAYLPPPSQEAPAVAMQALPQMPAAPAPPPSAAQPGPAAPQARCEAVGAQRAADAAANGLDHEMQEIVRRGAFTDCVAWDTLHPAPPP